MEKIDDAPIRHMHIANFVIYSKIQNFQNFPQKLKYFQQNVSYARIRHKKAFLCKSGNLITQTAKIAVLEEN